MVGGLHHPEGAAVAGAALDQVDLRVGDQAQHVGGLWPHVLRAGVAGVVHRNAARDRRQSGGEAEGLL